MAIGAGAPPARMPARGLSWPSPGSGCPVVARRVGQARQGPQIGKSEAARPGLEKDHCADLQLYMAYPLAVFPPKPDRTHAAY